MQGCRARGGGQALLTQLVLVCRTDRGWLVVACEHKAGDLALLQPQPLTSQVAAAPASWPAGCAGTRPAGGSHGAPAGGAAEKSGSTIVLGACSAVISLCSGRCIENTRALPASSFTVAYCQDLPRTCWLYCPSSATCWTWCASMLPTKELRTLSMCLQRRNHLAQLNWRMHALMRSCCAHSCCMTAAMRI